MLNRNDRSASKPSFFTRADGLLANSVGVGGAFFGGPLLHELAAPVVGDFAKDRYAEWLEGPARAACFLFCLCLSFAAIRFGWSAGMKELIAWWRLRKV